MLLAFIKYYKLTLIIYKNMSEFMITKIFKYFFIYFVVIYIKSQSNQIINFQPLIINFYSIIKVIN